MSTDIFGGGLHADVDALLQRAAIERACPCVVVDQEGAACMGHGRDRRNVRHLEGLRARRFDHHRRGVRFEEFGDTGTDQGIEIAGLDAIASQQAVAECARRPVDAVGHQKMVAGFEHRQQRRGDRRQARGHQGDARAVWALDCHQRLLQCLGRRCAVTGVAELAGMGMKIRRGRIDHGGTADNWRIDEPVLHRGVAARNYQQRFGFARL
jgi:hypothetical protein